MSFKVLVIVIVTILYLYDTLLNIIYMRSAKNRIPENVADVYDGETYQKWRAYHGENARFSIVSSTAGFILDLVLLISNAYAAFAGLFPKTDFMQMFAVILLLSLASLLMLPFSWYSTMVIEEKYGFNKTTARTFWMDQAKSFVIELLIMTVVGAVLMWVHQALGDWLILVFAGLMMLLILIIVFLYPVLSKIFNKFTPMEEGELKEKLTGLLEKHGYKVRAIQVMDASRRTTKSNAYFAGFG